MKNYFFNPRSGYSIMGKIFRGKIMGGSMRQCLHKCSGRNFSGCMSPKNDCRKILSKSSLGCKENRVIYYPKRFLSSRENCTILMDFKIVWFPSLILSFKMASFYYFVSKYLDETFDLGEFVVNSKTALGVVSTLLAQSRFSDLEELLTSECKAEVVKNVAALLPSQRKSLAVEVDDIIHCFPYNLQVIKDCTNSERMFVQITVVHHVLNNLAELTGKNSFGEIVRAGLHHTIYNTRFIREYTKGVDDQWTINAINIWKMSEHVK